MNIIIHLVAAVVVIVWWLDLQLPTTVPIITNVVSLYPSQVSTRYNIM